MSAANSGWQTKTAKTANENDPLAVLPARKKMASLGRGRVPSGAP
jgi:hypothetical protein